MFLSLALWNTPDKAPHMALRIVTTPMFLLFYTEKMFRPPPITPPIPLPTLHQPYAAICALVFQTHAQETQSLASSDQQKNDSYFIEHTARSQKNGEGAHDFFKLFKQSNRSIVIVASWTI
jgi:hypothetical protein